ncbi:DEAD/DEAH box helicase [Sutcliffiella horikoshii]|uniref:DEAD/DEAH box helicase n=1 Tax=Sutcliffiella horikoshii TaxID=79883 RepID=A0A5D4SA74_9BACI|nr:DEAD/DEAH box helicase [Sutcliffiella horikoshii]TYS60513.1 DEAD/DEAH box helicase [Sutcliffiella horikoshii]
MLQIFVTSNIRIKGAPTPLKAAVTKALTYDNPAYVDRKKKRRPVWGIEAKIKMYFYNMGDLIVPRGFLKELKTQVSNLGINPDKVMVNRQVEVDPISFGQWNPSYQLKEDQLPFVSAILNDNGIGVAPAGSGKTVMGMKYIHEKKQPALWLTHTRDLMYQTKKRAEATLLGVGKIGLIGDGVLDYGDGKLIIATVQTLQANPHIVEGLKQLIGTLVIDEAHHFPAPQFIDVAGHLPAKNVVGLTATPDRKDNLEIYMFMGIGPIIYEISRDGLYESGRLIKPEIRFVYTDFQYEQASVRNEINSVDAGGEDLDYNALKNELIHDEARAKLVAENILEASKHGAQIVITESVRYCFILKDLVEKLTIEKGKKMLSTAVVHGGISRFKWLNAKNEMDAMTRVNTGRAEEYRHHKKLGWQVKVADYTEQEFKDWQVTKGERKAILEAAENKQVDVLFATQLAREGLDLPHLAVGHMAMPKRGDAAGSRNGSAVEQEIGRIMRPDPLNPGKKAYWFDYVDYNVGVLKSQYNSRRSVYNRLKLKVPSKPRTQKQEIEDFLDNMPW